MPAWLAVRRGCWSSKASITARPFSSPAIQSRFSSAGMLPGLDGCGIGCLRGGFALTEKTLKSSDQQVRLCDYRTSFHRWHPFDRILALQCTQCIPNGVTSHE